jgi:hypothetical protein
VPSRKRPGVRRDKNVGVDENIQEESRSVECDEGAQCAGLRAAIKHYAHILEPAAKLDDGE